MHVAYRCGARLGIPCAKGLQVSTVTTHLARLPFRLQIVALVRFYRNNLAIDPPLPAPLPLPPVSAFHAHTLLSLTLCFSLKHLSGAGLGLNCRHVAYHGAYWIASFMLSCSGVAAEAQGFPSFFGC